MACPSVQFSNGILAGNVDESCNQDGLVQDEATGSPVLDQYQASPASSKTDYSTWKPEDFIPEESRYRSYKDINALPQGLIEEYKATAQKPVLIQREFDNADGTKTIVLIRVRPYHIFVDNPPAVTRKYGIDPTVGFQNDSKRSYIPARQVEIVNQEVRPGPLKEQPSSRIPNPLPKELTLPIDSSWEVTRKGNETILRKEFPSTSKKDRPLVVIIREKTEQEGGATITTRKVISKEKGGLLHAGGDLRYSYQVITRIDSEDKRQDTIDYKDNNSNFKDFYQAHIVFRSDQISSVTEYGPTESTQTNITLGENGLTLPPQIITAQESKMENFGVRLEIGMHPVHLPNHVAPIMSSYQALLYTEGFEGDLSHKRMGGFGLSYNHSIGVYTSQFTPLFPTSIEEPLFASGFMYLLALGPYYENPSETKAVGLNARFNVQIPFHQEGGVLEGDNGLIADLISADSIHNALGAEVYLRVNRGFKIGAGADWFLPRYQQTTLQVRDAQAVNLYYPYASVAPNSFFIFAETDFMDFSKKKNKEKN